MRAGKTDSKPFHPAILAFQEQFTPVLDGLLPATAAPETRLYQAMRYAALGPGKRLRPYILHESAQIFDVPVELALRAGAAVEMVHAYSLVHDDLPAMDDDDLRRGRPTCHIAFDEGTAILVGDALQALAFETLASEEAHPDASVRAALVEGLAKAVGGAGMAGGQILDLRGDHADTAEDRRQLARMKTGALFAFAARAGAILGQAGRRAEHALAAFASDLGLVFQTVDDLLDEEGDESAVGKRLRKDAEAGKPTLVSMLGTEGARFEARRVHESALRHLEMFGSRADALRTISHFILNRSR